MILYNDFKNLFNTTWIKNFAINFIILFSNIILYYLKYNQN